MNFTISLNGAMQSHMNSMAQMMQSQGGFGQAPGQRLFRYLDGQGSVREGLLSFQEFSPLCQQIGVAYEQAQQWWWQTDTDRSGTLSEQEFLQFCARPDVSQHIYKLEAHLCPPPGVRLFKFLDGKGGCREGVITWQEFSQLCPMIGWPLQQAQSMWWQSDLDRSGTLNQQEFLRFANRPDVAPFVQRLEDQACSTGARLFDHVDRSRMGQVSWQDFSGLIQQIGWPFDAAQRTWWEVDQDRSGTLSRQEFMQFANRPDVRPQLERLAHQMGV